MDVKYLCKNMDDVFVVSNILKNKYFFDDFLYEHMEKVLKKGNYIYIFKEKYIKWCYYGSNCEGCSIFDKCQNMKSIDISRLTKLNRILR